MSAAKAIFTLVMFVFWGFIAIYFGFKAISGTQEILETPDEDAYYEAHGCYISDGGRTRMHIMKRMAVISQMEAICIRVLMEHRQTQMLIQRISRSGRVIDDVIW